MQMSDNTQTQLNVSPELVMDVLHTPSILRLSLRAPGYMNINGCSLVMFTIFCNFVLGMLAIVSRTTVSRNVSDFFSPTGNHFGFLWLVSTIVTFIGLPIFLTYILKPVRQVTFDRTRNEILSGNKKLCLLTKLDYVRLTDSQDTDRKSLTAVSIDYADGALLEIVEVYDEQMARDIANMISRHTGKPILWSERGNFPDQMARENPGSNR
jgi:hypothetical protein